MKKRAVHIEQSRQGLTLVTDTLELAEVEAELIRYAVAHADSVESAAASLHLTPAELRRRAHRLKIELPSAGKRGKR